MGDLIRLDDYRSKPPPQQRPALGMVDIAFTVLIVGLGAVMLAWVVGAFVELGLRVVGFSRFVEGCGGIVADFALGYAVARLGRRLERHIWPPLSPGWERRGETCTACGGPVLSRIEDAPIPGDGPDGAA
jgi:hypothetical protein